MYIKIEFTDTPGGGIKTNILPQTEHLVKMIKDGDLSPALECAVMVLYELGKRIKPELAARIAKEHGSTLWVPQNMQLLEKP